MTNKYNKLKEFLLVLKNPSIKQNVYYDVIWEFVLSKLNTEIYLAKK